MHAGQARARLNDALRHGPGSGAELFIVEGESAAHSVAAVCAPHFQAVLPLQGKPMNAWRARADKVRQHALYAQFAQAMGMPDAVAWAAADADTVAVARFERVVLLMDPDADGIHIGALMLLYLQRFAPALIASGRVAQARAPMFVLAPTGSGTGAAAEFAYSPLQFQHLQASMATRDGSAPRVQSVRGLGSMPPALLAQLCVDPRTRQIGTVSTRDVGAVIDVFGALGDAA